MQTNSYWRKIHIQITPDSEQMNKFVEDMVMISNGHMEQTIDDIFDIFDMYRYEKKGTLAFQLKRGLQLITKIKYMENNNKSVFHPENSTIDIERDMVSLLATISEVEELPHGNKLLFGLTISHDDITLTFADDIIKDGKSISNLYLGETFKEAFKAVMF